MWVKEVVVADQSAVGKSYPSMKLKLNGEKVEVVLLKRLGDTPKGSLAGVGLVQHYNDSVGLVQVLPPFHPTIPTSQSITTSTDHR